MTQDVHDFQHKLTLEERHVYENVLSYLTTSDILAMRNIGLAVMEKMSAHRSCRFTRRARSTRKPCTPGLTSTASKASASTRARFTTATAWCRRFTTRSRCATSRLDSVLRPDIDLNDRDELENFIMAYTFFAGVFEGTWFYNGFSPIFALQRRGLMKGTSEQLQYIMRDEVLHASFGIRVCNQIILEENLKLDPKMIQQMWEEAEAAEMQYAKFLLPDPILGYSADDHIAQFRFIANRRANKLNHAIPFPGAENALPWLDEQANLKKEKELFRNPRHRVPDGRCAELGLFSSLAQQNRHLFRRRGNQF